VELRKAILARRSVRVFRDEPIPAAALRRFEEAILWAPSAGNLQSRRFAFVTDPAVRAALGRASAQPELFRAPLVVVGCADARIRRRYGERGVRLYAAQDVAAATQNLLLTVADLGLGAVWVGAFEPATVREALGLPPHLEPVVLVPVGHPAEHPEPPERLPPSEAFLGEGGPPRENAPSALRPGQ